MFELKIDRVISYITRFLEGSKNIDKKEVVFQQRTAETIMVTGQTVIGEYTQLNKKLIHLILSRREKGDA